MKRFSILLLFAIATSSANNVIASAPNCKIVTYEQWQGDNEKHRKFKNCLNNLPRVPSNGDIKIRECKQLATKIQQKLTGGSDIDSQAIFNDAMLLATNLNKIPTDKFQELTRPRN